MKRLRDETILGMKDVLKLRCFAWRPCQRTVYYWARQGLLIRGKPCRLESEWEGGRLITSEEAVLRFLERTRKR